jgi:hypothetical protein
MPQYRRSSHASARDRLVPKPIEAIEALWPREPRTVPAPQATEAAYRQALARYFRGQSTAAEVGQARLAWCAACAREVDAHARERKPLERLQEVRWGRRPTHDA